MRFLSSITQHSYSPNEIRASVRSEDFWRFNIAETAIVEISNQVSGRFYANSFEVDTITSSILRGTRVYCAGSAYDALTLRRTNEILKQSLRTTVLHRDDEVSQLLAVLKAEQHCEIFRTDISSLFESIDFANVIRQLEADGFRNQCTLHHLRSLNRHLLATYNFGGLPRGIGLSSTLADYVFRDFDNAMLNADPVVYYARYVDDICLVFFKRDKFEVRDLVEVSLPQPLKVNERKTERLKFGQSQSLKFLGYSIALDKAQEVTIAASKIARHKKRIALSIQRFLRGYHEAEFAIREQRFALLMLRLKFLTGNVRMKMLGRNVEVFSGIKHVYRLCTNSAVKKQLIELDRFLHGIVFSKRFQMGRQLRASLRPAQLQLLRRFSYLSAYENNITYDMNHLTIADVKRAWKYE